MDLPDPGIELGSPALQADSLPTELPGKPLSILVQVLCCCDVVGILKKENETCVRHIPSQGQNLYGIIIIY